ncbi:MAG: LysR family transcriptional regulator [Rhodobacteraceae bacterium]|nr:LysR family transcriptional regulator [Paracoccaceae bacterium]
MDWLNLPPLNSLRAFSALAETGSFARAAEKLNVTYPAVSQQVKGLEEYLGTTLIIREGRGFRLSDEGAALARDLETAFLAISRGVDNTLKKNVTRPIQITTSPAFAVEWLMPRISEFQLRHPDIMLMLNPTVDVVELKPGGVDLAIRYCNKNRVKEDTSPVLVADMVVIGSTSLLDKYDIDGPGSLRSLPWLEELGTNEVKNWFERLNIEITSRLAITQMPGNLIMGAVRRGDGITYTAKKFFEKDIDAGQVQVLQAEPAVGVYHLEVNTSSRRPAVRKFANWILSKADVPAD